MFLGAGGGPRWGQVGAKLGQVAPKLAQVGPKLGSSRHLEAMLPSSCRHLAILARVGAILEATWPNWSRQRGQLGRDVSATRAGPAGCAGPLESVYRRLLKIFRSLL